MAKNGLFALTESHPRLIECVNFHGHLCPGLSLGYRASILAMERLNEKKAEDEEILAIVENDSCFVDAVQVITGCTFGKGNLIWKDHGKMALTLTSRRTGRGIRVCLKKGAPPSRVDAEFFYLMDKIIKGVASDREKRFFEQLKLERSKAILEAKADEIFSEKEVSIDLPAPAQIVRSEICEVCEEPVMLTKLAERMGKKICRACAMEV